MPIFDTHAYLAETPFSNAMASREAVQRTMNRYGIHKVALISGLAAQCDFMTGNRQLREMLDPTAGLFGWVTLNTGYPAELQEEQRRHMTRRVFVGAALFGDNGRPVLPEDAREILNAQRRFSKPVALHVPDAEAVHAARRIAAEYPAMKFVLLTMGGDDWHTAVAAAKQHLNIYLEISGSLASDKIDAAAATLSPRKLLYGSGLPFADPSLTVALVQTALTLTAADRERIFSQNADALLRTESEERWNRKMMGSKFEKRLVAALIALTLFLTSLPYLLGYFSTPPGAQFIGTAYNIDDYCNYLSWLRQTSDGHFFLRNLFTTDPQNGLEFNVFFWLLGQIVRVTHFSPQFVLQLARVGGGLGLLWLIYCFYRHCLPDNKYALLTAFGFACLGSGLGWLPLLPGSPPDVWQPEAFLFYSIYASALFTVSTLLILGTLYALLLGEETGRWRFPVIAGLCGAALGNIHSYDVLHLAAAWGLFLLVWTIAQRGRGVGMAWARGVLALALTLPTTAYQYYLLTHEIVFKERAAVPTLSPAIWYYFWGYGLVFLLALAASVWLFRSRQFSRTTLFVACWAVAGLLIIYLPVAFQRKMLMGEHIPLCLLAGLGAAWLTQRLLPRWRITSLTVLVLATFPSNAIFLRRDILHLIYNRSETASVPYLDADEVASAAWIRANTPPDASVIGFPPLCLYLPGQTGRAVWAGHWGETPDYKHKLPKFVREFDPKTPDAERHQFLQGTRAQYLYYPNDVTPLNFTSKGVHHEFVNIASAPPSYLTLRYRNATMSVYQISR